MLARVRHPNVVTVYGADQTEDTSACGWNSIKGRTLAELLKTQGTFGAHEAALIGRDLCRAVAAVHQAGVLHGDIKAHNVMRQEGGRTVLMDFGAGQSTRSTIRPPAGLGTSSGRRCIWRRKCSTDSHQPRRLTSTRSACCCITLPRGSYPVSSESLTEIVQVHKTGERRRLRDVRPDLPDDFVRIVEQATAVDPARRFASAGAFEDALVRHDVATSAAPVGVLHGRSRRSRFLDG